MSNKKITSTPATVKQTSSFQSGLELTDIGLSIYLTEAPEETVHYTVFLNNQLLFEDNFRPSPIYTSKYSLESIVGLLGIITLAPGDTDPEYFENHTTQQLEWCKSPACEALKLYISNFEEDQPDAMKYFKDSFIYTETVPVTPLEFNLDHVVCQRLYNRRDGWHTANIKLTHKQKQNFLALFGSRCRSKTWEKLKRAVSDNFRNVGSYGILNRVLFEGNEVSYCAGQDYKSELSFVRKLIIKAY
jgi:hypothetical protein